MNSRSDKSDQQKKTGRSGASFPTLEFNPCKQSSCSLLSDRPPGGGQSARRCRAADIPSPVQ